MSEQVNMDGISAVVLAAGLSRRMGAPKMLLPWKDRTIIEQAVCNALEAGVTDMIVVTGGFKVQIEHMLASYPVKCIFNPNYANGEMLQSFQVGLGAVSQQARGVFMVLGDQPGIPTHIFIQLVRAFQETQQRIYIPSINMRRGHPWLIGREYWAEISNLIPPQNLRQFLILHEAEIHYITVDTDTILQDVDTPEDYQLLRGKA